MKTRTVAQGPTRTIVAILDAGDEAVEELQDLAARESLSAASFTAIGAVQHATLGWYDLDAQEYREIPVPTQAEVLSIVGDVALGSQGRPTVHAHAVLGLGDGTTRGGHLLQATVRPVLEVTLTEAPDQLRKTFRPEFGLALVDLDARQQAHD